MEQLVCTLCPEPKRFNTKGSLQQHVRRAHADALFHCEEQDCDFLHSTRQAVLKHAFVHHWAFTCDLGNCNAVVIGTDQQDAKKREQSVRNHLHRKHKDQFAVFSMPALDPEQEVKEKKIVCDLCDKRYASVQSLSEHKRFQHADQRIACFYPGCNFARFTPQEVYVHYIKQHGEYTCDFDACEGVTIGNSNQSAKNRAQSVYRHLEKNHPDYIRRSTARSEARKQVVVTQQAEKDTTDNACEFCGGVYSSASTLAEHKYKYHTDRLVHCPRDVCQYKRFTQQEIDVHVITKHDDFVCNLGACKNHAIGTEENKARDRVVRKHVKRHYEEPPPPLSEDEKVQNRWEQIVGKATTTENGCLLWNGVLERDGYARTSFMGSMKPLHVISWTVNRGPVPDGMIVRHKCPKRNLHCFALDHIEVGTHAQNNGEDKERDGTLLHGQRNPNATITDDLARAIFQSKSDGTQAERAARFSVPLHIVETIDAGYTYATATGASAVARERMRVYKKRRRDEMESDPASRKEYEAVWTRMLENSKRLPNGCLQHLGKPSPQGFVSTTFRYRSRPVHVLTWEIHHNDCCEIDDNVNYKIVQTCKTIGCIEKDHLKRQSNRQIARDRLRQKPEAQRALAIKESKGSATVEERAATFGVRPGYIKDIDNGRIWEWL